MREDRRNGPSVGGMTRPNHQIPNLAYPCVAPGGLFDVVKQQAVTL